MGAIEDYVNADARLSFEQGDLAATVNGTIVTYTITEAGGGASTSASLDLAPTTFEKNAAVNDLDYIFANDLLRLAFFP